MFGNEPIQFAMCHLYMWGCLDRQLAKGSKYSNCESYRANKAIQTKSDTSDPQTASISSLAAASMQHPSSLPPFFAPVPTFSSPGQRDACHVRYLASTRAPGLQERNSSKSRVWRVGFQSLDDFSRPKHLRDTWTSFDITSQQLQNL